MSKVFSSKSEHLLRDEMCICLDDLLDHLTSKVPAKIGIFNEFFNFLAGLNPPHQSSELGSPEYYENDKYLNREIMENCQTLGIKDDTDEYFIVDAFRHAFISFKDGGLYSLYKNRQAENWYPKIIVRRKIGKNNLSGNVVIYRGTSKEEHEIGKYSQSWTLKKEVAMDFAFKHYQHHEDYISTERVVLKSTISSRHIYYYDESDNEQEVIIDEREIINKSPTVICNRVLN